MRCGNNAPPTPTPTPRAGVMMMHRGPPTLVSAVQFHVAGTAAPGGKSGPPPRSEEWGPVFWVHELSLHPRGPWEAFHSPTAVPLQADPEGLAEGPSPRPWSQQVAQRVQINCHARGGGSTRAARGPLPLAPPLRHKLRANVHGPPRSGRNPTSRHSQSHLDRHWLSPGATEDAVGARRRRPVFKAARPPSGPQSPQDGVGDAPGFERTAR